METVEGLAPDAASVTAARKLARPGPWTATGYDERAVWGLCKGSGARPYQTQVDLSGPAYNCSCPSRKFPCKHALALLLLRATGDVSEGEAPEWVVEWHASRGERAARAATRPAPGEPPRDPEAAARRGADREARVAAGVEDLRTWLRDAVRGSVEAGRLRSWDRWDTLRGPAGRRAGARCGVAAAVAGQRGGRAPRRVAGAAPERARAAASVVRGVLARGRPGARRRAHAARLERAARGRAPGPQVRDRWIVLARVVIEQERLRVQRTWLWGSESGRPALLLDFAPPGAPLEPRPAPGMALEASLAFHPSATPLRALVAESGPVEAGAWFVRRQAASRTRSGAVAAAVASNPWLDEWPVVLREAVPDGRGDGAWTASTFDGALPLGGSERARWRLLAVSGGRPVSLFGLWDGEALKPLAAGDGTRTVAL